MRKVVDYKIVEHSDAEQLAIQVKEHLEQGWELQGAMTFASWLSYPRHGMTRSNWLYCQTVVRYSDDPFLDKTAVTEYLEQK